MSRSRSSGRSLEFHGASELAEATTGLLEDDMLDLVVVRGVTTVVGRDWHSGSALRSFDNTHNLAQLTDAVPEIADIDTAVNQWLTNSPFNLNILSDGHIHTAYLRDKNISPHTDSVNLGPITFSIRVDNNPAVKRDFYAYRPRFIVTDQAGHRLPGPMQQLRNINNEIKSDWTRGWLQGLTRMEQMPGDVIMFTNHPSPTIHAASIREGSPIGQKAEVLIASYHLEQPTLEDAIH